MKVTVTAGNSEPKFSVDKGTLTNILEACRRIRSSQRVIGVEQQKISESGVEIEKQKEIVAKEGGILEAMLEEIGKNSLYVADLGNKYTRMEPAIIKVTMKEGIVTVDSLDEQDTFMAFYSK